MDWAAALAEHVTKLKAFEVPHGVQLHQEQKPIVGGGTRMHGQWGTAGQDIPMHPG